MLQSFLDSVDTPGGHLVLLMLLMAAGVGMESLKLPKGEDVLVGAFGALLMALRNGAVKTVTLSADRQ